jgi:hypothetical protein
MLPPFSEYRNFGGGGNHMRQDNDFHCAVSLDILMQDGAERHLQTHRKAGTALREMNFSRLV